MVTETPLSDQVATAPAPVLYEETVKKVVRCCCAAPVGAGGLHEAVSQAVALNIPFLKIWSVISDAIAVFENPTDTNAIIAAINAVKDLIANWPQQTTAPATA